MTIARYPERGVVGIGRFPDLSERQAPLMIHSLRSVSSSATECSLSEPEEPGCSLYDRSFWLAHAANTLVAVAAGLNYRYADFVAFLGGSELHLGWIVGVGMVGSVLVRLGFAPGIDRHGPRRVWVLALALLAASSAAHLAIDRYDGVGIYVARMAFCTALAGVWSASTTFVSSRGPTVRMAELIGMLGTSGFLGIMIGTQLGDWLCADLNGRREPVDRLFIASALLAVAAIPCVLLATRGQAPFRRPRRESLWTTVKQHQGVMALVLGVSAGAAVSLPATFLRTFAAELGIRQIGTFFTVCAVVAMASRLGARRVPERLGLARMIVVGYALLAMAQFLYLPVRCEWHLVLPGAVVGIAQAILFPTIVAESSMPYPPQYRGVAMTLILAALDVGQMIGAPAAGAILHGSQALGLPGYPTLFVVTAAMLLAVASLYSMHAWSRLRRPQYRLQGLDGHAAACLPAASLTPHAGSPRA